MGPERALLYQVEGVGGSATQLHVGTTQYLAQCFQSWLPRRITWGLLSENLSARVPALFVAVVKLCLTLCNPVDCSTLDFPVCHHLQNFSKFVSIESVMPSNYLILCCPLLLLPSVFPSIRVFTNESALHIRWTKYWSFSFSITPSNEYSGLIFFRVD